MTTSRASLFVTLLFAFANTASNAQATSPAPAPETPAASLSTPPAAPDLDAAPAPGSDVRIVRLSQVKGQVQLDRDTGHGYETAFANLPIIQNSKLQTTLGIAEVEFEDNSSLRLTPETVVDFPALSRTPSGATVSTIHVVKGTVYLSLANTRGNQVLLTFGPESLTITPSTHLELTVGAPTTRLAVFDGSADVARASGLVTVSKKKELVFDPSNATAPTLLTKIEKTPFDDWDKGQVDYHKRYSNASAFGGSSGYGISDLNYYGSFANLPGCGNVWRPYFASAAWDPFANGVWAWYPNAGYSWVSPYPWGWTPFHSGAWQQCGAGGWGWQPGGQWTGLRNSTKLTPLNHPLHGPWHGRPPLPPSPGHPTLIPVNTRPLSVSRLTNSDTFVFSKDSAGLGVPRQTFGKLSSPSNGVDHHGAYTAPVSSAQALVVPGHEQRGDGAGRLAWNGNARTGTGDHNNTAAANHSAGAANTSSHSNSGNSSSSGGWSGSHSSGGGSSQTTSSAPSAPSSSSAGGGAAGTSHTGH